MNAQTPKDEHRAKDEHAAKGEPAAKPSHDEVEKTAYSLSRRQGRPQASAEENWLEAEAQLQHPGSGHAEHPEDQEHQGHQDHHAHMAALMAASTVIVAINARLLSLKK
jgi:hypothetical protein